MDTWFSNLSGQMHMPTEAVRSLQADGFVVLHGLISQERLPELAYSYDEAVSMAAVEDVRIGPTTTKVDDFINRGAQFDELYISAPILEAACHVIQQPFMLSAMLARTLRPRSPAQKLHVDAAGDADGWPMLGFIYMIDDFTVGNGATCFLPGSHGMVSAPESLSLVPACGLSGSVIVYNGAVWHGHGSNHTDRPRRSIQGVYLRRSAEASTNLRVRMLPQTLDRIGPLARYLLAAAS